LGTVSSSGLSYLTQQGGPLANLSPAVSLSALQSASPKDVVSLSEAAVEAQQADVLFGIPHAEQSGATLPAASAAPADGVTLPGVSSADLSNATPQEKGAINGEALLLQQAQELFGEPSTAAPNTVSVYG
jgi:hypothetical protein